MRIAVVGSGYVGLVAGACFADLGHQVVVVDNDRAKLDALKNGQVPIHENFLPELLAREKSFSATEPIPHALTSPPTLNSCARAPPSPIFFSPTAS
jgi:UDP-glucose 6-dehydrogenase